MRRLLVTLVAVAGSLVIPPIISAPVPKSVKGPGTIFVWNNDPPALNLFTPEGEHIREVALGTKQDCKILGVSPGARFVVVTTEADKPNPNTGCRDTRIHLLPLADACGELPEPVVTGWLWNVCWSADGRRAFVTLGTEEQLGNGAIQVIPSLVEYDTVTGRQSPLDLGRGHLLWDVSSDEQTFLTTTYIARPGLNKRNRAHLVRTRPNDTQPLDEPEGEIAVSLHPDGKRVFMQRYVIRQTQLENSQFGVEHFLLDPETKTESPPEWASKIKDVVPNGEPTAWAVSPDGKRVLLRWSEEVKKPADWEEAEREKKYPLRVDRLGVCDLNGNNFKIIYAPNPKTTVEHHKTTVNGFAWR